MTHSFPTRRASDLLLTATCDPNVQSERMMLGGGRSMVMATRGFTRGVHYWEVQVNSAQWGSVFIGVAPKVTSQPRSGRSEEHTSELQSLMRISYAVFCSKNTNPHHNSRLLF